MYAKISMHLFRSNAIAFLSCTGVVENCECSVPVSIMAILCPLYHAFMYVLFVHILKKIMFIYAISYLPLYTGTTS